MDDLIGKAFAIEECGLCGWFVRCPDCGNNSCNGGGGKVNGKKCETCTATYAIQDALSKWEQSNKATSGK